MTEELFEKRILFEALDCILANQQTFIEYCQTTSGNSDDPNRSFKERVYMACLREQCHAIVERLRWVEAMERDKKAAEDLCQK